MQKIKTQQYRGEFQTENMNMEKIDEDNIKYYATGFIKQQGTDGEKIIGDLSISVILDMKNMIFSIIPN